MLQVDLKYVSTVSTSILPEWTFGKAEPSSCHNRHQPPDSSRITGNSARFAAIEVADVAAGRYEQLDTEDRAFRRRFPTSHRNSEHYNGATGHPFWNGSFFNVPENNVSDNKIYGKLSMISRRICSAPVLTLTLIAAYGCDQGSQPPLVPAMTSKDDHGHDHGHDHEHEHEHESLAAALTELTKLRDTIRDGFAKNDVDAAHDPLHEVGHVLEEIPELAEKEKLPAEAITIIKASVEELFDAFGAVDKGMHGGESVKYADVSGKIDAAVTAITSAAAPAAAPPSSEATAPAADATAPTAEPAAPVTAEPAAATEEPKAADPAASAAEPAAPAAPGSGS